MERALKLIIDGALTIAVASASNGKTVSIPSSLNHYSGKESKHVNSFNDTAWGKVTRQFTVSASNLEPSKFDRVVKAARQYILPKANRARKMTTGPVEVIEVDTDNERECLVSDSEDDDSNLDDDSDSQCKLFYLFCNLTNMIV